MTTTELTRELLATLLKEVAGGDALEPAVEILVGGGDAYVRSDGYTRTARSIT